MKYSKRKVNLEKQILKILKSGNWGVFEISFLCKTKNVGKVQKILDKLVREGKIVKHKYLYSLRNV